MKKLAVLLSLLLLCSAALAEGPLPQELMTQTVGSNG